MDTTGANGDQFISEVSGLSGFNLNAKEGNITLTAGGAILDSDNDVDVTANIANLTVTGGIGENLTKAIQGNIDALVFSNNGTGSVFFNQVADGGNLTVSGKNTAESQNIFIKVQGDNAVLTVAAQDLKSANGIISLTADDMDILGNVDAGSSYVSLNTNNAAKTSSLEMQPVRRLVSTLATVSWTRSRREQESRSLQSQGTSSLQTRYRQVRAIPRSASEQRMVQSRM